MKIGPRRTAKTCTPSRRTLTWVGVLILVFVVGWIAGNQTWQEIVRDLRSLPDLISRSVVPSEDLSTLVVDMDFVHYDTLLNQREKAMQAGVYIPSAQDFVTATIREDGTAIPVNMRLQAGPVDHLDDDGK